MTRTTFGAGAVAKRRRKLSRIDRKTNLASFSFCRGIILCIMDDANSISVKLIDYGDIISVKCSQILQLLPCFRNLPSLAIKAELAGNGRSNIMTSGGGRETDCIGVD